MNSTSNLILTIACQSLPNLDTLSRSDPFAVAFEKNPLGKWVEIGRTEIISNCLDPSFITPIKIGYHFEKNQNLKIALYDCDTKKTPVKLENQGFIGITPIFSLHSLIGASGQKLSFHLEKNGKSGRGQCVIYCEETSNSGDSYEFQFSANGLPKMDFFGSCDPFFTISRMREDGKYFPIYKSTVIKKTLNPTWPSFKISLQALSNGDVDCPILFEIFDWDKGDNSDFIGSFSTSPRGLAEGTNLQFKIANPNKKKKSLGVFKVLKREQFHEETFLSLIKGGINISMALAVDFTLSNGDPSNPSSLHFINSNSQSGNDYQQAISSVTKILLNYDTDKLIPCFGFGAKLPDGSVSHCFSLNGNPADPFVSGVDGILSSYSGALSNCKLYGPTVFSRVISKVSNLAQESKNNGNHSYYVLLILTDGVISDWEESVEQVVKASNLPMSIIIVGIGNGGNGEAWEKMEELDGDDSVLKTSAGVAASADILQFVAFNKVKEASGANEAIFGALLAEQVLCELPQQVANYYKKNPHLSSTSTEQGSS